MIDHIKITGRLDVELYDAEGRIKQNIHVPNLVVTSGKAIIAKLLSSTGTVPSHIAVGNDNTPAQVTDAALYSEIASSRVAISTKTTVGVETTYHVLFAPGVGTGTIKEAGIFNASTLGEMLARTTFTDVVKGASDTLVINWTIKIN